jgi:proline-specific peptidase
VALDAGLRGIVRLGPSPAGPELQTEADEPTFGTESRLDRYPYPPKPEDVMRTPTVLFLALSAISTGCGDKRPETGDAQSTPTTDKAAITLPPGEHTLAVETGTLWYKVSGAGTGVPVILLHGGPGMSSFYMKPLEEMGDERKVVRYDQVGAGKSDRVTDTSMFNIDRFVRELDSLRRHLGYDKVHVVGHSWGTILGVEYYRAHPANVASLTLASPALDIPTWERNAKRMLASLPDSMQRAIREAEKSGDYSSAGYKAANDEFTARYVVRRPLLADLDSLMSSMNPAIYLYMQGPSEFTVTGTLRDYDATPFLKEITVPVLFTVGEFDEADPATVRRQAKLIRGARVAVIDSAAHLTTWDNPVQMLKVVREFLREADGAAAKTP